MSQTSIDTTVTASPHSQGCLNALIWVGCGFVLPCSSLSFYRQALHRKLFFVVLFFFIFTTTITILTTIKLTRSMLSVSDKIRSAYQSGRIPEIVIQDGIATANVSQPYTLLNEPGMIIMIDTTGIIKGLDQNRYQSGILLTRTNLHVLNEGTYRVLTLAQLQKALNTNPIVLNNETALKMWQRFSGIFSVVAFLGLLIWNGLVRFMYLNILSLVGWALVSLSRSNTSYSSILSIALYANVPAVYASYLLGRAGIHFLGLQTLVWLVVWSAVLVSGLSEKDGGSEGNLQTLRPWRTLFGLPMLLVFGLDVVFAWENGAFLVWAAALLTLVVLAAAGWASRSN